MSELNSTVCALDEERTLNPPGGATAYRPGLLPCLTILAHPDPSRIGQRAVLRPLRLRQPVELNRYKPCFVPVGEQSGTPLADPFLTRSPIRLESGVDRRSVVIDCCERTDVMLNRTPLVERTSISRDELRQGVVLTLSARIALLLHLTGNAASSGDALMIGESDAAVELRRQIRRVASVDAPVLIRGETGVGKELVAAAIHRAGARASLPMISTNMATLMPSTAASSLFGHARGAFTGAEKRHRGLFRVAHGGTLFLDEIGETPPEVQSMLLRVLETSRVQPLGHDDDFEVDLRVVAATDRDLEADEAGAFRAALLHRLSAHTIRVPALRDRREDIPRLLLHFMRQELHSLGREDWLDGASASDRYARIPAELIVHLVLYPFPGNVRELKNIASQLLLASLEEEQLRVPESLRHLLEFEPKGTEPTPGHFREVEESKTVRRPPRKAEVDEASVQAALQENDWSPSKAARALGVAQGTIQYWIKRNPAIRRAQDIGDEELEEAARRCAADVTAMAAELGVSVRALRLRLAAGSTARRQ